MADPVRVSVTVNGRKQSAHVEPRLLLVHFLRDTLGLTGTHVGCDTSNCGACTVHLDGEAVKSCTVLAVQADGAEVTTIEGMGNERRPAPVQEAFWAHHGLQCGYCTPGMIMAARRPARDATRPERGGGPRGARGQPVPLHGLPQHRQGRAVRRRATSEVSLRSAPSASSRPARQKWVGQALKRKEDPRLITGRGRYVDDMVVAGQLYVAVVRSPEAHAKIVSIDTSGALERAASHGVFTGEDLRHRGAAADGLGAAGRRVKTPEHWPLAKGEVKLRRPARRRRSSARTSTPSSTPPSRCSSSTTRCRSSSIPRRRSRTASPLVHDDLGTNQVHEWSHRRRRHGRRPGPRPTSSSSGGSSTTARPARRSSRAACSPTTAPAQLTLHLTTPDPAPHPRCSSRASSGISEDRIRVIAPDVGGGFGVEAAALRRGGPRRWASRKLEPPGQVDRDALAST